MANFSQVSTQDLWTRLRAIDDDVVHCQYRWSNASTQTEREQVYQDCYDRMTEAKGTREEIADRQKQTPTLEFAERDQREVSLGGKRQEGDAEGDCSIRAISTLTGADYNVVAQECTTARNELLGDSERVEDNGIPYLALQKVLSKYKIEPSLQASASLPGDHTFTPPSSGVLSPEQAHEIYGDAILDVGEYDPDDEAKVGQVDGDHMTTVAGGKIYDTGDPRKSHRVVQVYQPTSETPAAVEESRKRWVSSQEDLDATARQLAETMVEAQQAETSDVADADAEAGLSNTLRRIDLQARQKSIMGQLRARVSATYPDPVEQKEAEQRLSEAIKEYVDAEQRQRERKPKRRTNNAVEYRKQKPNKPVGGRGGRGESQMKVEGRRRR